jgi:hypothetical protein
MLTAVFASRMSDLFISIGMASAVLLGAVMILSALVADRRTALSSDDRREAEPRGLQSHRSG